MHHALGGNKGAQRNYLLSLFQDRRFIEESDGLEASVEDEQLIGNTSEVQNLEHDGEGKGTQFQLNRDDHEENQGSNDGEDNLEASPSINLQDLKFEELIEFKKLGDEYYGEGVFQEAVEEYLAGLFVKENIIRKPRKVGHLLCEQDRQNSHSNISQ